MYPSRFLSRSQQMKIVPWYNAAEFKKVYQQLYSAEISEKRQALDQITLWQTRCHPSLPYAVDASATLTAAIIQDFLWSNNSSVIQQLDIQSIYSNAVIRFVNLTVEAHEKQYAPGSLANWAKKLGIPSYIIDMRNEATHSVKPSLYCLRIAAEFGMSFLKEEYWEKEVADMRDFVNEPINIADIDDLIADYVAITLPMLNIHGTAIVEYSQINLKLKGILKDIESKLKKDKRLFVKVLASSDHFIYNDKELEMLFSEQENYQFKVEPDVNSLKDLSPEESCKRVIPPVPVSHEHLWNEMIDVLNTYDAVPLFLEWLLKSQSRRSAVGQKLIISWARRLIGIRQNPSKHNCTTRRLFKEKGIVVDWYTMLFAAVKNPCKYTRYILPEIFHNMDLSKDETTLQILHLSAIYLGEFANCELPGPQLIHTAEEAARVKRMQDAEKEKLNGDDDNIWFRPSDDSYKKWPLGYIVNSGIEKDELIEEDNCDSFDTNEFVEKIFDNENGVVEHPVVDVQGSSNDEEIQKELKKIKNFLYTR